MNLTYRLLEHITSDYIKDDELSVKTLKETLITIAHCLPSEVESEIREFVESRNA